MRVVVKETVFWVQDKGGSLRVQSTDNDTTRLVRVSNTQLPDTPRPGDVWQCENFPIEPGTPGKKPHVVKATPLNTWTHDTWDAFLRFRFPKTKAARRTSAIQKMIQIQSAHKNNQSIIPIDFVELAQTPTRSKSIEEELFIQAAIHEMTSWAKLTTSWIHLKNLRLPSHICATLDSLWGANIFKKIEENPYRLLTVLPWHEVDSHALSQGIPKDSDQRLTAAVDGAMEYLLLNGKDTPSVQDVTTHAQNLSGQSVSHIIEAMIASGSLVLIDETIPLIQKKSLRLPGIHRLWQNLLDVATRKCIDKASRTGRVERQQCLPFLSVFQNQENQGAESTAAIKASFLTQEQKQAVEMAISAPFSLILGGAGTGKTTTLNGLHKKAETEGLHVVQCAISARAARRMEEATGRPAYTIAKLLILAKHKNDLVPPGTLVVIDEASMVDLATISRLIHTLPGNTRWCLVGDTGQLPPITFGAVLDTLVAHPSAPRIVLTQIHRQTQETGIPQYAQAIREGASPSLPPYAGQKQGVYSIQANNQNLMAILIELRKQHPDMMILSPIKKGPRGVYAINKAFHEHYAQLQSQISSRRTQSPFLAGEPVVFTVNSSDLGLLNGSLGTVQSCNEHSITIDFDGSTTTLTREQTILLDHAYALTVHKAQGSQWKVLAFITPSNHRTDKRMLYTAITRAQDLSLNT